jgi:hypothetical protein
MMTPPKKVKWVQLNVRVASELRDKLTKEAKKNGVSINVQAAQMLGRAFEEREALGGEVGREMLLFLADAFVRAGNRAAKDRKISEWINEPDAYEAAMFNVVDALMIRQPGITLEKLLMKTESLKGRFSTKFVNAPERAPS